MSYSLPLGMNILWFGCDVGTLCTTSTVCEAVCRCGQSTKDECILELAMK